MGDRVRGVHIIPGYVWFLARHNFPPHTTLNLKLWAYSSLSDRCELAMK
jgi:hypothetical protein